MNKIFDSRHILYGSLSLIVILITGFDDTFLHHLLFLALFFMGMILVFTLKGDLFAFLVIYAVVMLGGSIGVRYYKDYQNRQLAQEVVSAIEAYAAQHEAYPKDLNTLVPNFIDKAPYYLGSFAYKTDFLYYQREGFYRLEYGGERVGYFYNNTMDDWQSYSTGVR